MEGVMAYIMILFGVGSQIRSQIRSRSNLRFIPSRLLKVAQLSFSSPCNHESASRMSSIFSSCTLPFCSTSLATCSRLYSCSVIHRSCRFIFVFNKLLQLLFLLMISLLQCQNFNHRKRRPSNIPQNLHHLLLATRKSDGVQAEYVPLLRVLSVSLLLVVVERIFW